MTERAKPLVAVASMCERVLQEKDSVFSAIRLVDHYEIGGPPATGDLNDPLVQVMHSDQMLSLSALVVLKSGDVRGTYDVSIVARTPSGPPTKLPQEWKAQFNGDESGTALVLRFALPPNSPFGLYWFDVVWEGEVLTSIPLRLKGPTPSS